MEKKNKYVCTIGFNKNNPYHKKAADILNKMPRGKADYIAQAILAYQGTAAESFFSTIDYEKLKEYILQVIKEYECSKSTILEKKEEICVQKIEPEMIEETVAEETWTGILTSLNAFRQD